MSEQLPGVAIGAVVGEPDDVGAVGGGHGIHAQDLVGVAVEDAVPAVAVRGELPGWSAVDMPSTPRTLSACGSRIRYRWSASRGTPWGPLWGTR
ncbi:hypothetical protein OG524_01555 [Streptomyces sp. NBC_01520]|uniref:hypothetical protein n=1 Tax=Streptomyces sp. NBC_01520 TaxID=2903892 RepID=UPI0038641621